MIIEKAKKLRKLISEKDIIIGQTFHNYTEQPESGRRFENR